MGECTRMQFSAGSVYLVSFLCALILFSRGGVGNHFEKKTAMLSFFRVNFGAGVPRMFV